MSFYEDASLVMIPSGYKSGKIYSQKPLSTDGQLTFTRASDATRVASNGLIEKVRTNEVLQSQTFDDASWGKSLVTITANFDTAPNGTLTADRFVSAGGAFPQISQARTVVSGTQYTASLYVKSDGTAQIPQVFIVTGNTLSFTPTSTWQRISITFTAASSSISLVIATNSAVAAASSFVIWGVQLETGDIATDYIPTTTAAVSVGPVANIPRLDYLNSTCPKLLLEPQRTNLVTFSENFDNAAWTKLNATVTANAAASPDGYVNADKLTANSGAVLSSISNYALQTITKAASAIQYTYSVFAKQSGLNRINVFAQGTSAANHALFTVSLVNGTISTAAASAGTFTGASASVSDYGNGWYRCALVFTTNTDTALTVRNIPTDSTLTTGNGTDGILIYGAQLEAGAYATSYIPTLGASQTRVADAASKTGISSLIGQTEGTLFLDANISNLSEARRGIVLYADANNFITLRITSGNDLQFLVFASSASQANLTIANPQGNVKMALAYKANDFAAYLNGTLVGTDTSGTVPATSGFYLGYDPSGASQIAGGVNQALLFKTRLTNDQLAELTSL